MKSFVLVIAEAAVYRRWLSDFYYMKARLDAACGIIPTEKWLRLEAKSETIRLWEHENSQQQKAEV